MASHAFGAIQDIQADREAKLSSIATVFGAANTARFALWCYVCAGLLIFSGSFFTDSPWRYWVAAATAIPFVLMVLPFRNLSDADCEQANSGWKWFLAINFIAGFVVCMLLINNLQNG